MSYPNVPLGKSDWDRKLAQAVNHLLNQVTYMQFVIEGQPADGESVILTQFPVKVGLLSAQSSGWAGTAPTSDAVFTVLINGSSAGTITFPAGSQDATVSLSVTEIPAFTDFEITAPTPQDATLADVTLTLVANL